MERQTRKKKLRLCYLVLTMIVILLWLPGCGVEWGKATDTPLSRQLPVSGGAFYTTAWLDEERIAFLSDSSVDAPRNETRIKIYSLRTGKWHEIPSPQKSEDCFSLWMQGPLRRLPNGNLGFVAQCNIKLKGEKDSLYMWDKTTDTVQLLEDYRVPFAASAFAFSPDMSHLIQENAVGAGLNNELYWVKNHQLERLLSEFQRARTPTWSANGQTIAFWETDKYPGGKSSDFTTWPQIEGLLTFPWDLYLMDPDGGNLRIILEKVQEPGIVRWSPSSDVLAYDERQGDQVVLYLLNPETRRRKRIFSDVLDFDWSPDGKQMVIIFPNQVQPTGQNRIGIIDVPPAP